MATMLDYRPPPTTDPWSDPKYLMTLLQRSPHDPLRQAAEKSLEYLQHQQDAAQREAGQQEAVTARTQAHEENLTARTQRDREIAQARADALSQRKEEAGSRESDRALSLLQYTDPATAKQIANQELAKRGITAPVTTDETTKAAQRFAGVAAQPGTPTGAGQPQPQTAVPPTPAGAPAAKPATTGAPPATTAAGFSPSRLTEETVLPAGGGSATVKSAGGFANLNTPGGTYYNPERYAGAPPEVQAAARANLTELARQDEAFNRAANPAQAGAADAERVAAQYGGGKSVIPQNSRVGFYGKQGEYLGPLYEPGGTTMLQMPKGAIGIHGTGRTSAPDTFAGQEEINRNLAATGVAEPQTTTGHSMSPFAPGDLAKPPAETVAGGGGGGWNPLSPRSWFGGGVGAPTAPGAPNAPSAPAAAGPTPAPPPDVHAPRDLVSFGFEGHPLGTIRGTLLPPTTTPTPQGTAEVGGASPTGGYGLPQPPPQPTPQQIAAQLKLRPEDQ